MKKLLSIIILIAIAGFAFADTTRLMLQNDAFLPVDNHDHFYSNGTRFEYEFHDFGIAVAQYMYTPEDKTTSDISYGDRPYCGYLYLAGFKHFYSGRNDLYTELQTGTIGKYSYAGKTQNFVHKIIGSHKCNGWNHQIKDEFIVNGYIQDKYTMEIIDGVFQVIPQVGLALGNYYDGVNIGGTIKIGYNLPKYDKIHNIEPVVTASETTDFSAYIFVKPDYRWVWHNTSLEGSIFDNDSEYTVEAEPTVIDVYYGVGVSYKLVDVEFSLINRSREFKGQDTDGNFGTITVSISF